MTTEPLEAEIEATETAIPPVDLPPLWAKFDNALIQWTKVAVFVIGVAFTVMVTLEVASRFIFNHSMSMSNGASRLLLVWFFMIGSSLALRQGAHVGLNILTTKLAPLPGAIVYFLAQTLTLSFLAQMVWGGYAAFGPSLAQIDGSLGISLAWVMAAFPVGFGLLIYHQAVLVTGTLRQFGGKSVSK